MISDYILSVDPRIWSFIREAREIKRNIKLLDLSRKDANKGEVLQHNPSGNRYRLYSRPWLRRNANLLKKEPLHQVKFVHYHRDLQLEIKFGRDMRSDIPGYSTKSVVTHTKTEKDVIEIEEEALELMQRRVIKQIPSVFKGRYPFTKTVWLEFSVDNG